jgi:hypothetical protein
MDSPIISEPRSDPDHQPTREVYTHDHGERVVGDMARRTLAGSLSFLLPHLRPGTRVVDCGRLLGAESAPVLLIGISAGVRVARFRRRR